MRLKKSSFWSSHTQLGMAAHIFGCSSCLVVDSFSNGKFCICYPGNDGTKIYSKDARWDAPCSYWSKPVSCNFRICTGFHLCYPNCLSYGLV